MTTAISANWENDHVPGFASQSLGSRLIPVEPQVVKERRRTANGKDGPRDIARFHSPYHFHFFYQHVEDDLPVSRRGQPRDRQSGVTALRGARPA
jgi:hypothetical protein